MKLVAIIPILFSLSVVGCGGSSSDDDSNTSGNGTGTNTDIGDNGGGDSGTDNGGGDSGTANDSGGVSDSITGNVQFLGLVSVDEDVQKNEVDANGSFIRYTSGIAGNLFVPVYTPQLDVCSVETVNISDVNTDFPDIDTNVVPELVSAGEVVPLTSDAGTYIQLLRQSLMGFLFYLPEPETVPGPMPAQLTVNIPGDVYPAFSNVSVPVVEPMVVSSPAQGQPITPSTMFSWTPGSNSEAYISITATTFDATGTTTIVECEATDDGQFTFPAQTQSAMGATFSSITAEFAREALTIQQQGNAVLVVTATSGN